MVLDQAMSALLADLQAKGLLDQLVALGSEFGRTLRINDNDALTNLDGLSGISSVDGDLHIFATPALTNLDGLSGITSVGDDLEILYNDALTNIEGLSSLTSVVGDLQDGGDRQ